MLVKAEREKAEAVERARQDEIKKLQDVEYQKACEERKRVIENTPKEPTFTDDGKRIFTITATFEVSAPKQTPIDKIVKKLQGMIEGAGITTLTKIEVR